MNCHSRNYFIGVHGARCKYINICRMCQFLRRPKLGFSAITIIYIIDEYSSMHMRQSVTFRVQKDSLAKGFSIVL